MLHERLAVTDCPTFETTFWKYSYVSLLIQVQNSNLDFLIQIPAIDICISKKVKFYPFSLKVLKTMVTRMTHKKCKQGGGDIIRK